MIAIRTASNEVWTKLTVFEESVLTLQTMLQTLNFHRGVDLFKDQIASDRQNFEKQNRKVEQDMSALWRSLRSQQLSLGAGMHSRLFRSMQDLAIMRMFYSDQFQAESRGDTNQKDYEAAAEVAKDDLDKQEKELSMIMEQLY